MAVVYQVQNGRPPGNKDVEYDDMGNVVAVMRLDSEKLPNHRYIFCCCCCFCFMVDFSRQLCLCWYFSVVDGSSGVLFCG